MASKFKLGDMFTKKYTRDTIPLEIYEITYSPIEPVYKLKPIRLCGDNVILGEEALIELSALQKSKESLEKNIPLRLIQYTKEELLAIKSFNFINHLIIFHQQILYFLIQLSLSKSYKDLMDG